MTALTQPLRVGDRAAETQRRRIGGESGYGNLRMGLRVRLDVVGVAFVEAIGGATHGPVLSFIFERFFAYPKANHDLERFFHH